MTEVLPVPVGSPSRERDGVPLDGAELLPPALLDALESARSYARSDKAKSTLRAYYADWADFDAWCASVGARSLPADAEIVALYLATLADRGLKASTITRRVAAIRYAHRLKELEPPTNSEMVRVVLRGIRRRLGTKPNQKAPATIEVLADLLDQVPDTLLGLRDKALLAIGFAGGLRRSELVGLDVEHIEDASGGILLTLPRSKSDQEGRTQTVPIPNGKTLRPVRMLRNWLEAGEITTGPVFRRIGKGGRLIAERLAPAAVALVVKRYAELAGHDVEDLAGHSLRAGIATSALEHGADPLLVARLLRHAKLDTTMIYDRRVSGIRNHAGRNFL